jgi:hypothetical protein
MTTRSEYVAEARSLLGTKFQHQGRLPRLDCAGVLVVVGNRHGARIKDYLAYTKKPNPKHLIEALRRNLDEVPVSEAGPGDWLLVYASERRKKRGVPQHLIMVTDGPTPDYELGMLHCREDTDSDDFSGKVVEHGWGLPWSERIHSAWRYRDLED